MKIKALKPFVERDPETGALNSYVAGSVYDLKDAEAKRFCKAGLAEEYTVAHKKEKAKAEKK